MVQTRDPMTHQVFENGIALVADPASIPSGTVLLGSDEGLTVTAAGIDAALVAGTYSFIDVTVAQFTGTPESNVIYLVFNSAAPTDDLANKAVRRELHLQAGIGETRRYTFDLATNPLVTMKYTPRVTSNNISLNWEYR